MAKAGKTAGDFPFPADGDFDESRSWFAARLKGRSREDCILLAGRAALRALPYLRSLFGLNLRAHNFDGERHSLALLRCQNLALVAVLAPSKERGAFRSAARFAALSADASADADAADASADAAAFAASASADAAASADADAAAAAAAAFAAAAFAADAFAADASGAAFARDADMLDGTPAARRRLVVAPLWPEGISSGIAEEWNRFARQLREAGDEFDIWADWYGGGRWNGNAFPGVLQGTKPGGPSLFGLPRQKALKTWHDIALIPHKAWQEPARVNAEMKRIVAAAREEEEKRKKDKKPPPEIPSQRPAAIEPVWEDGKLRLPATAAPVDLSEAQREAALQSLKQAFEDLISEAERDANIDKRAIERLKTINGRIPATPPSNFDVHKIAHSEGWLKRYGSTVSAEWADVSGADYHALTLQFDRTMRQFPDWREFLRNADKERLSEEQSAVVPELIEAVQEKFREKESKEFIADEIPDAVEEMYAGDSPSEKPFDPIEEGNDLLAQDALESINNVLKRVAEAAMEAKKIGKGYFDGAKKGAKKRLKQRAEKDGADLVDYGFKLLKWGIRLGAPAGGAGLLISKFPEHFAWIEPILKYLH